MCVLRDITRRGKNNQRKCANGSLTQANKLTYITPHFPKTTPVCFCMEKLPCWIGFESGRARLINILKCSESGSKSEASKAQWADRFTRV